MTKNAELRSWNNLDLSQLTDIILHYKDGKATATLKNGG